MNPSQTRILFVDDDPKAGNLVKRFCAGSEFDCQAFHDPRSALTHFAEHGADVVVSDLRMPGMTGLELLQQIRQHDREVPVILITAHASVEGAIDALRAGATDFVKKPFDLDELFSRIHQTLQHSRLQKENRLLKRQLRNERMRYGMIGHSKPMQAIYALIDKVADIRCSVIVQGESGTGKELAARAIHDSGGQSERPFVVIDCGALTETLLESELFGHEKGAFTGATQSKQGLFEVASGGTVFLDEIGNISPAMQTRLLRAVEEQRISRVGGLREVPIDVRFIAASNRDLAHMVAAGEFRHDLYHRLNVVTVHLPPLRQRSEDLPALARHFIQRFNELYGRDVRDFDPASYQRMQAYDWPGNVRELRNLIDRLVALADGPEIEFVTGHLAPTPGSAQAPSIDGDRPTLAELERRYIDRLMKAFDGNRAQVAETLGIDKSTLWRRLRNAG